jgi:hypothetical protein
MPHNLSDLRSEEQASVLGVIERGSIAHEGQREGFALNHLKARMYNEKSGALRSMILHVSEITILDIETDLPTLRKKDHFLVEKLRKIGKCIMNKCTHCMDNTINTIERNFTAHVMLLPEAA